MFTLIDKLKTDFNCFKTTVEISHLDAICITAQLYFGITGLLDEEFALQLLTNLFTNETEEWFLKMLEQC